MRISLRWLKQYVDFRVSPEVLATRLTMQGLEVESIERMGDTYKNFVVGKVLEVCKHPNADKLTVCRVDVGKAVLSIVCGAPNVAVGQKVPVALVGAVIPRGQHDPDGKPFRLEQARIRGIESNGMICSSYELELGDDAEGIMVLDPAAKMGTPLAKYLGMEDVVLEIGVTPNRPDCLSHIGVAREVAAALGKKLRKPSTSVRESKEKTSRYVSVAIRDTPGCLRYSARLVRNVRIRPSPKWMQDALTAVGLRPVNNVVDVTNYVLMEFGHPVHAFDCDKIAGHAIIVKRAANGEAFVTLDGKLRTLSSEITMICDAERSVAIAGIMGGSNTEISESSSNVLIESAYFDPRRVRWASKFLGLSTDASHHFERGADPEITVTAVDRAAQLMAEVTGGEVLQGVVDVYPKKLRRRKVRLRTGRVNEFLGTSLPNSQIRGILLSLGLSVKRVRNSTFLVEIPSFRVDLEREIDLIEEVARIFGYDNIEERQVVSVQLSGVAPEVSFRDTVREYMIGAGFQEIVTNSMQQKEIVDSCSEKSVYVMNPMSKDMAALRASLVPGMLGAIQHNLNRGNKNLRLFELGRVFSLDSSSPRSAYVKGYVEEERVCVGFTGDANLAAWYGPSRRADIFDLKGELEAFFEKISLDKIRFIYYSRSNTLSETPVFIEINGSYAGYFAQVNDEWLKRFEIGQDVFVWELDVDLLQTSRRVNRKYNRLPRFPVVPRDLAFTVDRSIGVEELKECIERSGGNLLRSVRLFDVYSGESVPLGKKSAAFSVEFQSEERTLTEEEVESVIGVIVREMEKKFKAELRRQ
ncbi:MAG: phenylalanine--tRNA ligase subunit beta [Bacteroidota bacterium]